MTKHGIHSLIFALPNSEGICQEVQLGLIKIKTLVSFVYVLVIYYKAFTYQMYALG